jgi:hypothetical protein
MKALILFLVLIFPSFVFADEKDIIRSLEKIRSIAKIGVSLKQLTEANANADVEMNMNKKLKNTKFYEHARECLSYYIESEYYWKINYIANFRPDLTKLSDIWRIASDCLDDLEERLEY